MKVFIKILGLIGLINCIVLYGAEHKKGDFRDSIAAKFDALETGDYVGAVTGVGTGLYDPSSGSRQERRASQEGLMHNFSNQYADTARQTQPQPPFEKLISRFQDQSTRAFARRFLSDMTLEVRDQLNAVAPTSPVHRGRRLSTEDGQAGAEDKPTNTVDKQTALVEALMKGMQTDFAQKERIHKEEIALSKQQFQQSGEQTERLAQASAKNSRYSLIFSGVFGGAGLALSIAAFARTHS